MPDTTAIRIVTVQADVPLTDALSERVQGHHEHDQDHLLPAYIQGVWAQLLLFLRPARQRLLGGQDEQNACKLQVGGGRQCSVGSIEGEMVR